MQIQSGARLGTIMLNRLGISPDSRISVEFEPTGMIIWDLDASNKYTITSTADGTVVTRDDFKVPSWVEHIFGASNDELKKQWTEKWQEGWTEKRETIFTELMRRGVDMLRL